MNKISVQQKIIREILRLIKHLGFPFYLLIIGFIILLSFLIPKKKNLVVLIGMYDGQFLGNVKYMSLYLYGLKQNSQDNCKFYFLTENKDVFNQLKKNHMPVLLYPRIKSLIILLRTAILVVDSGEWFRKFKFHFLYKSKKVQLWHGVGLKFIQLDLFNKKRGGNLLCKIKRIIRGNYPTYDLVISTSKFYTENLFKSCFQSNAIIEAGYPRNDIFFRELDQFTLLNIDSESYHKMTTLKSKGYKIVLYAPTFRDSGRDILSDGAINFDKLDEFAIDNNILFIFKFHPTGFEDNLITIRKNIISYDNSKDIYPLLPLSDLLITDYSSIASDYLLLNKPIIFFPYDIQEYITKDRMLQFDYDSFTPGPKCLTQAELENEITKILIQNRDTYTVKRQELLNLAFDYNDGNSTKRIWNYIKENWLN
jgi:CDP-glycerol glycerophosphotransferase (TagB/SpsB family)